MATGLIKKEGFKSGTYTPTIVSGGTGTVSGTASWKKYGKTVYISTGTLTVTLSTPTADALVLSLPFEPTLQQVLPYLYTNSTVFNQSNSAAFANTDGIRIFKGASVKGSDLGTSAHSINCTGSYLTNS